MFKAFKKTRNNEVKIHKQDRGILVFENTSEVIKAESVLKDKGFIIKVMGPPLTGFLIYHGAAWWRNLLQRLRLL